MAKWKIIVHINFQEKIENKILLKFTQIYNKENIISSCDRICPANGHASKDFLKKFNLKLPI